MAQTNRPVYFRLCAILLICLLSQIWGCATYYGRQAFEDGEQLSAEERYDQAVEKYFEASELDPGKKLYKMKLIASRTRAAASHIAKARSYAKEGKTDEALAQYRLARGFDPSLEVAAQEEKELLDRLQAVDLTEEAAKAFRERNFWAARKILKEALERDPSNVRAMELMERLERGRQIVDMDGIELDITSMEPITLQFKDAKITEVFSILTKLTGINFILDEDVSNQTVTVLLEKASFTQAMQLILQMNGLNKKVLNTKTIIIYPQSRDKEKQYEDQIIQTFYLSHIDAKKAVNLLRTMLQLRKIYVHEERNALVIRDKPEVVRLAEQIIDAADRENSEVIFALEIVSVSNTDTLNLGPKLSTYSASLGASVTGSGLIVDETLSAGGSTGNLIQNIDGLQKFYTLPTATFELAKTLSDTEILASPKIRVRNREKAKVHIGTREPVITVTNNGDTFSDNVQYVDVGVKVDVEPVIQLNDSVETKLTLEVSQVTDRTQTERGTNVLTISTTNAQTVLTLRDGVQTILGGLFEQSSTDTALTIPFLGEIPLIGKLFSNIENNDRKREILLSITPYIVKQVDIPERDVATIWSGGEDNLKVGPNFGAFDEPLISEIEAIKPMAVPAMNQEVPPKPSSAPEAGMEAITAPKPEAEESQPLPKPTPTRPEASYQEGILPETTPVPVTPPAPVSPAPQAEPVVPAPQPQPAPEASSAPSVAPQPTEAVPPAPESPAVTPSPLPEAAPAPPVAAAAAAVPQPVPAPATPVEPPPSIASAPPVPSPVPDEAAQVASVTMPPAPVPPPVESAPTPLTLESAPKGPARLSFDGAATTVQGGDVILSVLVQDVESLYSAPLFVKYDPTLLDYVDAVEGTFLGQFGQQTVFSTSPNRTAGQVIIGYKQGVGGKGASGSGSLYTLKFKAKASGTARVELNRINFRDPKGTRLAVNPATTVVEIR